MWCYIEPCRDMTDALYDWNSETWMWMKWNWNLAMNRRWCDWMSWPWYCITKFILNINDIWCYIEPCRDMTDNLCDWNSETWLWITWNWNTSMNRMSYDRTSLTCYWRTGSTLNIVCVWDLADIVGYDVYEHDYGLLFMWTSISNMLMAFACVLNVCVCVYVYAWMDPLSWFSERMRQWCYMEWPSCGPRTVTHPLSVCVCMSVYVCICMCVYGIANWDGADCIGFRRIASKQFP